jgi:hypothetical protein
VRYHGEHRSWWCFDLRVGFEVLSDAELRSDRQDDHFSLAPKIEKAQNNAES